MHSVIAKLMGSAKGGIENTQAEFGKLLSLSPLSVKLDEDPEPLEEDEVVKLNPLNWRPEDVGKKVALMRCTNGQYLLLGVVE
ncbi:hypothetical protein [Brevibacillus formosus]|uniref:hypothetical protein n=1 Tax=Brevibacillus formosus TaxID=54913 RepID=UPI003F19560B